MASNDISGIVPGEWPRPEYYTIRRPIEEWVPTLAVLEEMERDEPDRFRPGRDRHEARCMTLYRQGKSREEVFAEISREQDMKDKTLQGVKRQLGQLENLKEQDVYQKQSAGGFRLLKGTSQGLRFDVPPREWIEEELIAFGARRPHGTTHIPDLQGEIHVALGQERWPGMAQHRFDALRQSLLLATNMLHCSGAALSSIFPTELAHPQRNLGQARHEQTIAAPLDDKGVLTQEARQRMVTALQCFAAVAPSITWVESSTIFPTNQWMSSISSGLNPPEAIEEEWEWDEAKDRDEEAGQQTRQVRIAIASEFVDAILDAPPDNEKHLFATFYAAISILHELGRFWALHRYETVENPALGEPFFGDHLEMNLGDAYLSWLFGGFIPQVMGKGVDECGFNQGMQWQRAHEYGMTDSGYDICYSMKISHIERILNQEEWTMHSGGISPGATRQAILHPQVPFRIHETARAVMWRKYPLTRLSLVDVRGMARRGDSGFVDYTLCPLNFCDLDWDDDPRSSAEKTDSEVGDSKASSDLDEDELAPLPAAAQLFFRHEMAKQHRQYLENKLRVFLDEKRMGMHGEVEFGSDGRLLAKRRHG